MTFFLIKIVYEFSSWILKKKLKNIFLCINHNIKLINILFSYIKRFKGWPAELNSLTNFLIDSIELRFNSIKSILAFGMDFTIFSLIFLPFPILRIAIITCTPCKARTRVVSTPMPLVAPEINKNERKNFVKLNLLRWKIILWIELNDMFFVSTNMVRKEGISGMQIFIAKQ